MKTMIPSCAIILTLMLLGCRQPQAQHAFIAPDQAHWVSMASSAPGPDDEELLPTQELRLENHWGSGPWLLRGIETLCGTQVIWESPNQLKLRLPASRSRFLSVKDGERWDGIEVRVETHFDDVLFDVEAPDKMHRLLVVKQCESEAWNLYLRKKGQPLFDSNMDLGWDDPSVFGGFEWNQPVLSLRWRGPREAEIKVGGKNHDVTLRREIDGVKVNWIFERRFKVEEGAGAPLTRAQAP